MSYNCDLSNEELEWVANFIKKLESYQKAKYIFRGCTNKEYDLVPNMLRPISAEAKKQNKLENLVVSLKAKDDDFKALLNEFTKKNSIGYQFYLLGQHYGLQTKLLDFTLSYKIAIIFSLFEWEPKEKVQETNGCIYVCNPKNFANFMKGYANKRNYNNLFFGNKDFSKCLDKDNHDEFKLIYINPRKTKIKNLKRMEKQEGCFIYFDKFDETHYCIPKDKITEKINITIEQKSILRRYLNSEYCNYEYKSIEALK